MDDFEDIQQRVNYCPMLGILRAVLFAVIVGFMLYLPLGDLHDVSQLQSATDNTKKMLKFYFCEGYIVAEKVLDKALQILDFFLCVVLEILHEAKLKFYTLLERIDKRELCSAVCCTVVAHGIELAKEEVDKVIEDEITHKLTTDLLQSIERKFQVDLERSVDMVLVKIKLILQNGTHHIQDKLLEIQGMLDAMKENRENTVLECLLKKENETSLLAEKALHQMVVCGYALIGQDPAVAVNTVVKLKNMIKQGVKPIYEQKQEIYGLLKVCGHQHDALRKVVQCVISKSPLIKTVMMDITGQLIEGVVELTKLMAHGAMHEACLIEVVKTVEDEAIELIGEVRLCAYGNSTSEEDLNKFLADNNATVLEIKRNRSIIKHNDGRNTSNDDEMQDLLRRMMTKDNVEDLDKKFKEKLTKLQININSIDNDAKSVKNKDK